MLVLMYAYLKIRVDPRVKIQNEPKNARSRAKSGRGSANTEKVMQLHKEGEKPVKIAKKLEIDNSTVYRILKKNVQNYETTKG